MITEDYCSFELSKLLKEKGFNGYDWCCSHVYTSWQMLIDGIPANDDDFTYAPTHQMAMKWLREEKNLFIDISFINHYTKDEILHTGWCFAVFHLDNFDEPYYKDIEYSTYEQAVEAALKYSLENLI